MLVVLPQNDLGFASAVDLEEGDTVDVGFVGKTREVPGGLQTEARDYSVSDAGEPSYPERLLRQEKSPQDIRIA